MVTFSQLENKQQYLIYKARNTLSSWLSLKCGFGRCGHGFDGCDGLGGLDRFSGFGGFDGLGGFYGFSGFGGLDG